MSIEERDGLIGRHGVVQAHSRLSDHQVVITVYEPRVAVGVMAHGHKLQERVHRERDLPLSLPAKDSNSHGPAGPNRLDHTNLGTVPNTQRATKCGVADMSSGSAFQQIWDAYEASGDDARVHRDVRTKLGMDVSAAPVITFLRDLEAFVADEDKLLLLLSIGLCGRFESQMSFLGLLLREDVLQTGIVDMLLEKVKLECAWGCDMEETHSADCFQ